mmetsp:Transcript_46536/g.77378  ORF Transcript_46536/g.77378 Transcript_46536/m.77378 type:complete len:96 (+) Transcript_46536:97-384(+)
MPTEMQSLNDPDVEQSVSEEERCCVLERKFERNGCHHRGFKNYKSIRSRSSAFSALAILSAFAVLAINSGFSILSVNSFFSLGTVNCMWSAFSTN